MATGAVKWFSEKKGYGFITAEDGIDVFVHCSAVKRDGFRSLNEGDQVEFEISHERRNPAKPNLRAEFYCRGGDDGIECGVRITWEK